MRPLLAAVGLLAFSLTAITQTDRGTITGTVTDPAGAVIANAMIQARNEANGAVYQAASSGTGNYTVAQLPAGVYDLTITVQGFKQYVRVGLSVEVAGTLRIDAAMEVGAATEAVTVTEAAPLLITENAQISYNVATSNLNELPILNLAGAGNNASSNYFNPNAAGLGNIRNPLSSVNLLPGTNFTTDNVLRINGMPSSSQSINVEGQNANNGFMGQLTQMTQASTDAIQELAIQTSNFAAEYGQAGGGYFNYTMKSGTNQLHGSGYDYFVNEALNAGTPFTDAGNANPAKAGQHVRNAVRQHDYGFTLGGPIVIPKIYNGHDKTFFFFSFEQFRQSAFTGNSVATVPVADFRNGDFHSVLGTGAFCGSADPLGQVVCNNEIFDPTTTRIAGGSVVRNPFTGNIIPPSYPRDPTALAVQNLFPLPNLPGFTNNYLVPGFSNFRHTTIPSLKLDHSISAKMKLSVYYSATQTESPLNNGFTQAWTGRVPQDILSQTARVNFDETLTPTLLLHLGAGLLHTSFPQQTLAYDQGANKIFTGTPFPAHYFPSIGGLNNFLYGGFSPAIGPGLYNTPNQYDIKPTFNASATWVKGNHTYKLGATAVFEGLPTISLSGAQGSFGFGAAQTADPWQQGQLFTNLGISSGFPYASFLLGQAGSLGVGAPADSRLGKHSYALYLQDTWKVTRKLTLDLGLRWDYVNLWHEEHGRIQSPAFNQPNPTLGGRNGVVIYEATCHCRFTNSYPYSIGPHLGMAYQITPKTVFRAGGSISYGAGSDNAQLNLIFQDRVGLSAPGYGLPAAVLQDGDPYGPGNIFGNPVLTWPNSFFTTSYFPAVTSSGLVNPSSPFVSIARNAGRLPRIFQWSIGLQREITANLVVEADYVGNRGAWWVAPELAGSPNYDALTPEFLKSQYGIDVTSPADHTLLNSPLNSPLVQARFPNFQISTLANGTQVVNSVYPGFPATQNLSQALRPYPQWTGVPPFLGPPMGRTWYDSLQIKATKRFSHGLSTQVAYTWEKSLVLGANSNTSYITPQNPPINDVFNLYQNKQLSGFDLPQTLTISFSYVTPKVAMGNGAGSKALSALLRDWTYTGLLRYQSGFLLQTPGSGNNLLNDLVRGWSPVNNPAIFGGGETLENRVAGQPLFLVGPNSHFDPTTHLVLNPKAWQDVPLGQWGGGAAYYNDFRWQRQPQENMGFGRIFRIKEKYSLQVRAEFNNIFNRHFYSNPSTGVGPLPSNPSSRTVNGNAYGGLTGLLSGGFGYVNWFNGAGSQPRNGQVIARFQF
jgi:hypothetical protein